MSTLVTHLIVEYFRVVKLEKFSSQLQFQLGKLLQVPASKDTMFNLNSSYSKKVK